MPEVRLILRTRESGAGVRSPAILKNIGLTSLTIYIYKCIKYYVWLKCIIRGSVFPPTLGGTVWRRSVRPDDVNK